jgi:hypothetical protein
VIIKIAAAVKSQALRPKTQQVIVKHASPYKIAKLMGREGELTLLSSPTVDK